jgi:hypothetical protein
MPELTPNQIQLVVKTKKNKKFGLTYLKKFTQYKEKLDQTNFQ